MKSYRKHLETLLSPDPKSQCNLSSAIFPVFYSPDVCMKLLFLNYWRLKRNLDSILCRLILRDPSGKTIHKKCFYVEKIQAYEINLRDWIGLALPFIGSIEIQFSSIHNLVFPYPAVVVHYQGKHFSTFVHSAQRAYTEPQKASKKSIIESGFNIYATDSRFPFVTFINGASALKQKKMGLWAINSRQQVLKKEIMINSKPFQTHSILLKDWKELRPHLNGKAGCMKVQLFQSQTFPRLIAGNYDSSDASMSITHTYYDLSKHCEPEDYWSRFKQWHLASLTLPLHRLPQAFTRITFYPIISPATFWIDLEIYNASGLLLKTVEKCLSIEEKAALTHLELSPHIQGLKDPASVRLIAQSCQDSIPSRIKIGLDVGYDQGGFPCNICTNFQVANPTLEQKKSAFRWAPMLPANLNGSIWCLNGSPKKNYKQLAKLRCTFYRKQDSKTLTLEKTLKPHGSFCIEHTAKTRAFFQDSIGWCVIQSENPFITTFYFSEHDHKMIGGDHGF